jgi:hypothetical protein
VSLVPDLPAWLHAIADYAVAVTLIVAALVIGGAGKAVAVGLAVGATVLVVSMLTKYPLGVVKVLPFPDHSAADYLAAAALIASPFALGLIRSAPGLSVLYLVAGVAVLGVSLITNYQYGPGAVVTWAPVKDWGGGERWSTGANQGRRPATALTLFRISPTPPPWPAQSAQPAPEWPAPEWPAPAISILPAYQPGVAEFRDAGFRPLREVLAERGADYRRAS